jgi:ArsR family transcriptional regulator, virulence genes transcriptional regulator
MATRPCVDAGTSGTPLRLVARCSILRIPKLDAEEDGSAVETAIAVLEEKAAEVAGVLRALANEKRLLILCHLAEEGEISVTPLAGRVGLSQSALSQHLARLREDGLVATRRESQVLHYRIADARVRRLLGALYETYCADPMAAG